MNAIGSALKVVGDFRRSYAAMNVGYYGLILVAMLAAIAYPPLQQPLQKAVHQAVKQGALSPLGAAYANAHFLTAVAATFLINLLAGSLLYITLPSLIVPFSGIFLGAWRAIMWGILFSPTTVELTTVKIIKAAFIMILIILEGQGYILAMLASYVQGRLFVSPWLVGATSHWQGYKAGVARSVRLYLLVAIVLAVAAVYEATIGIYVVRYL